MKYKEKLKDFNSKEKYLNEMEFLYKLVELKNSETILDYGCGNGTCIEFLKENSKSKLFGFDINHYYEGAKPDWFLDVIERTFDKIYFMHSLAHIQDVEKVIKSLSKYLKVNGKIYVITPNKDFHRNNKIMNNDYKPDMTVIDHFTSFSLSELFRSIGYKILLRGQFGKIIGNVHERLFIVVGK